MMASESFQVSPRRPNNTNVSGNRLRPFVFSLTRYYQTDAYIYYGKVLPAITSIVVIVNILLITTIIKGKFRTSTYVVMISIALADCLTGLVPLPFNIYAFSLQNKTEYLSVSWCYVYDIMQMFLPEVLHISSLHLTVGLAFERFVVVTFPLQAKRICTVQKGIIFSITIFVISICSQMDLFIMVDFTPTVITRKSNVTVHGCIRSSPIRTYTEYVIRTVFIVFLPCIILLVFTILLVLNNRKIIKWRKSISSMKNTTSALDRLNFAVVLISAVVILSETAVWTCLLLIKSEEVSFPKSHPDMMAIGQFIFQITSPINFVILCCLSEKFRRHFRTIILCGICTSKHKKCIKSDKVHVYSLHNPVRSENTRL